MCARRRRRGRPRLRTAPRSGAQRSFGRFGGRFKRLFRRSLGLQGHGLRHREARARRREGSVASATDSESPSAPLAPASPPRPGGRASSRTWHPPQLLCRCYCSWLCLRLLLQRRGQVCDHASQFVTTTDKDFAELLTSSGLGDRGDAADTASDLCRRCASLWEGWAFWDAQQSELRGAARRHRALDRS